MNIVNRLTWKHMKLNRRRTAVTVVGVIISAAMLTAVFTMVAAWQQMCIDLTVSQNGLWHAAFENLNEQQVQELSGRRELSHVAVQQKRGYGLWNGEELPTSYRPYVYIVGYDDSSLENFPVKLTEGRMPQGAGELVVSRKLIRENQLDVNVGDTVKITMGNRRYIVEGNDSYFSDMGIPVEDAAQAALGANNYWNGQNVERFERWNEESYTIVGIAETIAAADGEAGAGYECITYFDSAAYRQGTELPQGEGGSQPDAGNQSDAGGQPERTEGERFQALPTAISQVDAYCVWKKPGREIFTQIKAIAKEYEISDSRANAGLLEFLGLTSNQGAQQMILQLAGIMAVIVMIGSVSLIYNAFAISVSERLRHLGMLSSVGATRQQLRNSVFFEGLVIGAMGIIPGILAGFAGLAVTFAVINPVMANLLGLSTGLTVVVKGWVIVVAALLTLFTILLSAFKPAMQAGRISPIEAIRQTTDVRLSAKQVRTGRLTSGILGLEGNLSLKNLKRNRRRYHATVLSLAISLALFLSVAYFGENFSARYAQSQKQIDFDISAIFYDMQGESGGQNDEVESLIAQVRQTSNYDAISELRISNLIAGSAIGAAGTLPNADQMFTCMLVALGDQELRDYGKEQGMTDAQIDQLFQTEKPGAILIDPVKYMDYHSGQSGRIVTYPMLQDQENVSLYGLQVTEESDDEAVHPWYSTSTTYWHNARTASGIPVAASASGDSFEGDQGEYSALAIPAGRLQILLRAEKGPMGLNGRYSAPIATVIVSRVVQNAFLSGALAEPDSPEESALLKGFMEELTEYTSYEFRFLAENDLALQEELNQIPNLSINNLKNAFRTNQQMLYLINVFCYGFVTLISLICVANIFNTISTSVALRRTEFAMLRSVGMTPKQFTRMIRTEGALYGIQALLVGLPLSVLMMLGIHFAFSNSFDYPFHLPWPALFFGVAVIFVLIFVTMAYATHRLKRENIIDSLREENA